MTNPVTIVINRPHGEPVRLRVKGAPTMMEDGSICVTCRNEKNHKFWISVHPTVLHAMTQTLLEKFE